MLRLGLLCGSSGEQAQIAEILEQLLARFWPRFSLQCLPKQETAKPEAVKLGAAKSEAAKPEAVRLGAAKPETVSREATKQDAYSRLAALVLLEKDREAALVEAERIWQEQPRLPVIFVARQAEDVFGALGDPFFHIVRLFALEVDLKAALEKLMRLRPAVPESHSFLYGNQIIRFFRKEILYLESDRHEICIHLKEGRAYTTETLGQCEEKLQGAGFARIHKSFLVNMYAIESLEKDSVLLSSGERLYISRYRYPEVRRQFENYVRHLDFM